MCQHYRRITLSLFFTVMQMAVFLSTLTGKPVLYPNHQARYQKRYKGLPIAGCTEPKGSRHSDLLSEA